MAEKAITIGSFPDRGPIVFSVTVITLALATAFLLGRIICRIWIVKRVSWDDYAMLIAWILAVGLTCTIDVGTIYGLGRYDSNASPDQRLALRKTQYVFSILYNPALMALKTSILGFYLRLSRNTQPVLRIASWVVLAIVNIAGAVLTLVNIFQCRPISASFSQSYDNQARCIPLLIQFICRAPINIGSDLAILALPIPVLTRIRLPIRQKCILVITFSLGVFVTVVAVIRIYYLQNAITTIYTTENKDKIQGVFGDSPQYSWNVSLALMWSAVEVNVGMICACVPTLKPLIMKIIPGILLGPDGILNSSLPINDTESDKAFIPRTRNNIIRRQLRDSPPLLSPISTAPSYTPLIPPQRAAIADLELQELTSTHRDHIAAVALAPTLSATQYQNPVELPPRDAISTTIPNKHKNGVYFGFVNIKRPKSIIETSTTDSVRYCILVTSLFLLWGISYEFLDWLQFIIANITNISNARRLSLVSVYFGGGYLFGPLIIGDWMLRRDEHSRFRHKAHKDLDPIGGFKATFILGLCIYGIGTLIFWPSAVLLTYPGILISNFVVGLGLSVLETAANPFIILCGPPIYAEVRILIAQGFQGVATVLADVVCSKLFFNDLIGRTSVNSQDLLDVQWAYLAIGLLCVALALIFYYIPLPEVCEADLNRSIRYLPVDVKERSIGGLQLRTVCIIFAIFAQWTYVAAQECMSLFVGPLLQVFTPKLTGHTIAWAASLSLSPGDYITLARAIFTISRFNAAFIAWFGIKYPQYRFIPSPRSLLTIFISLSIVSALVCVILPRTANPNLIAIPIMIYFFAEGPLWPLIFALGLRGQGDRTKRAGAWLTMGASGAAVWPFVMYEVFNRSGQLQLSYIVVVILLVFTLAYPVLLTGLRSARGMVDRIHQGKVLKYPDNALRSDGLRRLYSGGSPRIQGSASLDKGIAGRLSKARL